MSPDAARRRLAVGDPLSWAVVLASLAGLGLAVLGGKLLLEGSQLPGALQVGLILIGGVQLCCAYYALRGARAAWSFALSLNGTAFVVFLFGAPKLRDAAEVPIGAALAPALIFATISTLYALSSDDF